MNPQPNNDPICYFVLLNDSLQFVYTSPSFNAVVPNANLMIGKHFVSYLGHPANQSLETISARLRDCYREDVGGALDVIHLPYATVSAIRYHLQTGQQLWLTQPEYACNQFSVFVSRAGGFILAFLHDKAALSRDCGFHLCESLKPDDLSSIAPYIPPLDPHPPYHVFQVLLDDARRPIIFTTPTTLAGGVAIAPYVLAEGTQNATESTTNQGNTSCTKRTKLSFVVSALGGQLLSVSAVSLRHGNTFLVMYTIVPYQSGPSSAIPIQPRYNPPPGPPEHYQTNQHPSYRRTSVTSDGYVSPHSFPTAPLHHSSYDSPYSPSPPLHHPRGPSFEGGYTPVSPDDNRSSLLSSPRSPMSARSQRPRAISMRRDSHAEKGGGQGSLASPLGSLDEQKMVMAGSQRLNLHSPTDSIFGMDNSQPSSSTSMNAPIDISGTMRGRPAKEPPKGVTQCRVCGTTSSPEWRRGPTTLKDLCNACGLRWTRRTKRHAKGEGQGEGDSAFNGLSLSMADMDQLLEPQRSGGGSKKGHRKKTLDSRAPALSSRPVKRRFSDTSGMSGDHAMSTSPHDSHLSDLAHEGYLDQQVQHAHPHNPHHFPATASHTSRPVLTPLFDAPSPFPPRGPPSIQPHTPLTASSTSASEPRVMGYRPHRGSLDQHIKSPTPEAPHGYFPPPNHPPEDRKPPIYPPPAGSPPNRTPHINPHHGRDFDYHTPPSQAEERHGLHQPLDRNGAPSRLHELQRPGSSSMPEQGEGLPRSQ